MMKPIEILFVTHTRVMGGANRSMLQLIKELERNFNVKVTVLLPIQKKKGWDIEDECVKQSITYISNRYYWFKYPNHSLKSYIKYFLNFLFLFQILYKIRKYHFDFIHSNGSVIDIGEYLSLICHVKHVWHFREFGDLDFSLKPLFGEKYESFIYHKADACIAISKSIRNHYLSKVQSEKIHLIYNGIAPDIYNKPSKHLSPFTKICISGLVSEAKNQIEAVKAIDLIVHKYNYTKLHLYIIGNNRNDYYQQLQKYIDVHELNSYITFTGMLKDVPEYLSKMDIGLMLSRNEAFGRVTIEYMLQNLAVIASNTGANEEIITNKVSGLIYKYNDVEALASLILELCNNKDYLLEIAMKGKEIALNKFISPKNTYSIYSLYMQLLNKV